MELEKRVEYYKKRKTIFTKRLRRTMTYTEKMLWKRLRDRRFLNLKFRRQVNIGPYTADFLCKQHRLVIEVDGDIHDYQKDYDLNRDQYLKNKGYSVLRIQNHDVLKDMDIVLQKIYDSIFFKRSSPSPDSTNND